MSSSGTMGISPALLQAISQTLSSSALTGGGGGAAEGGGGGGGQRAGGAGSVGGHSASRPAQQSVAVVAPNPVFAVKSGQTFIIVQNLEEAVALIGASSPAPVVSTVVSSTTPHARSAPPPPAAAPTVWGISSPPVGSGGQSIVVFHRQPSGLVTLGGETAVVKADVSEGSDEARAEISSSVRSVVAPRGRGGKVWPRGVVWNGSQGSVLGRPKVEPQEIGGHHPAEEFCLSADLPPVADTQTIVSGGDRRHSDGHSIGGAMEGQEGVSGQEGGSDEWPASATCPVCYDKVSGYHYGIFSCESCKGFFKRTVQNGKEFSCRHGGSCDVSLSNRKKCPACRFSKCCRVGMKLEAIRLDRTRGGRSSYKGCYSAGTSSQLSTAPSSPSRPIASFPCTPPVPSYVTIKRNGVFQRPSATKPFPGEPRPSRSSDTPELLEELIASELAPDDEGVGGEPGCCEGRLGEGDKDPFGSLLHITDHCLYKLVRWARGRPDFANIQTDDQILLLQNCWAELVCVNACWKSLRSSLGGGTGGGEDRRGVRLDGRRVVTMAMARDMGIEGVVERLAELTEDMRGEQLDIYDLAALKTLLLMSPDVDNLKNVAGVRDRQERTLSALAAYTSAHYPHRPHKLARLLAALAQLSRTSLVTKELLVPHQASGRVPAQSLLGELLRGDAVGRRG